MVYVNLYETHCPIKLSRAISSGGISIKDSWKWLSYAPSVAIPGSVNFRSGAAFTTTGANPSMVKKRRRFILLSFCSSGT